MYADPYFQDVPWEIFYDESDQVIGVLYVLLPKQREKIKGGLKREKYTW